MIFKMRGNKIQKIHKNAAKHFVFSSGPPFKTSRFFNKKIVKKETPEKKI